jgi:hypothetical protein
MTQEIQGNTSDIKFADETNESQQQQFASTGADFYDYERELTHCWKNAARDWTGIYSTRQFTRFWDSRDNTS